MRARVFASLMVLMLALGVGYKVAGVLALDAPPPVQVLVTESIGVSDGDSAVPAVEIATAERIGVSDAATLLPARMLAVSESISVSDVITLLPARVLTLGESIRVSDLVSILSIDAVAPTTTVTLSAQPNAAGWINAPVTLTLSAKDNTGGSGVQSITYSAAGAQTIGITTVRAASTDVAISADGVTTLTFAATDKAGNAETPKTLVVKLDKSAPIIIAAATTPPNSNGWYNSNVIVHFTCADTASGVAACPADQILSREGSAVSSTAQTATDLAGNVSASSNLVTVKIDKTPALGDSRSEPGGQHQRLEQHRRDHQLELGGQLRRLGSRRDELHHHQHVER